MHDDEALSAIRAGGYRLVPSRDGALVLHAGGAGSFRIAATISAWLDDRSSAANVRDSLAVAA